MNKPDQEELHIPAAFTHCQPRDPEQWEIITQRLAVLYLSIHHPEHPSLDTLYGCYRWINDLVNEETPTHGITQEYRDYFHTHEPHSFLSVIGYEFERWHRIREMKH